MTSSISTTGINVNYPVAGVDNNSQGFRDNFSAIANQFTTAASEITALQNNAVVSNSSNNLNGNTQQNLNLLQFTEQAYQFSSGLETGSTELNWLNGGYQYATTTATNGTRLFSFSNFGVAGKAARMTVEVVVAATGTNYITWPASVRIPLEYGISVVVNTTGGEGFVPGAITVNASGAITAIAVEDGGSGYGGGDTVTIQGGGGFGATATLTLSSTVITNVNIGAGGSGYQSNVTGALPAGRHIYEFVTRDAGSSINLANYLYYKT